MNTFDAKAATWDDDPAKVARAMTVAEAILEAMPLAGRRVLEYGCGTGLLGFALQPHAGAITLADSSEGMLAVLRAKVQAGGYANLAPARLDLMADPLPAEPFDLVCSLMVMHHIPDTAGILSRFHDLLVPGGWVALADLDLEDGSFHGPGVDVHPGFDRGAFQARLEAAGFQDIRITTVFDVVRDHPGGARSYPAFLALARRG